MTRPRRLAIVGGGWAGLAAAVHAQTRGWHVTLFEASRQWGGRARSLNTQELHQRHTDHQPAPTNGHVLDNGQHILIGAYTETLALMQRVGVEPRDVLHAMPLTLRQPDGRGLGTPDWARHWPAPWDVVASIAGASGWRWRDKARLLLSTVEWRLKGFQCPSHWTVAHLCQHLPPRVLHDMIDPLCVAALNTPMARASASVFLRVLQDALLGQAHPGWRASDLLLPTTDLGALFPTPASTWLQQQGAELHLGTRVQALEALATPQAAGPGNWRVHTSDASLDFDAVLLACPAPEAARLVAATGGPEPVARRTAHHPGKTWAERARTLQHEAIATVYLRTSPGLHWPGQHPMLALDSHPATAPAQFVFNRGLLDGPNGLLAFVASASEGDKDSLEDRVLRQCRHVFPDSAPQPQQTVVEKRATFACTPQLLRPDGCIAPGLWAAGDYVAGPYPATLEGAVRSGQQAVEALGRALQLPGH